MFAQTARPQDRQPAPKEDGHDQFPEGYGTTQGRTTLINLLVGLSLPYSDALALGLCAAPSPTSVAICV